MDSDISGAVIMARVVQAHSLDSSGSRSHGRCLGAKGYTSEGACQQVNVRRCEAGARRCWTSTYQIP